MKLINFNLQEIVDKTFEKVKAFNPHILLPALREADKEPFKDELWDGPMNTNGCALYVFSTCLVDLLKPKQVVELGGAMGMWSLCVLHTLPKDSRLYSITLPENGLEFSYVVDKYPNFYPIVGDDLDFDAWPDELVVPYNQMINGGKHAGFLDTDIWYIDTIHTAEQLKKELELYTPYFKKGALVLFDDIRLNDMFSVWESLPYEKKELTDPLHWTGWGICKV